MKTVMDRYFYGVCGWTYSESLDLNGQLAKDYFADMTSKEYQDLLLVRNVEEVPDPPKFLVAKGGA
jgi:hypothetical protein